MSLIHETLYRTKKFSRVDMGVYLDTLVGQVVGSYSSARSIKTVVDADGFMLDLARATPAGLIVNELVTNSLKYGFPPETVAALAERNEACTIGIRMAREDGNYVMKVYDNGAGLPASFDPLTAKSLGLKLVNFLAKHQLRAYVGINTAGGTEFTFRFKETLK